MTYNEEAPALREQGPGEGWILGKADDDTLLQVLPDAKTSKVSTFAFESVLHGQQEVALGGRNRWTLRRLIERGNRGLTAAECPPGLRLAALVHNLRKARIPIDATTERHEGEFAGNHSRYRLGATVTELR